MQKCGKQISQCVQEEQMEKKKKKPLVYTYTQRPVVHVSTLSKMEFFRHWARSDAHAYTAKDTCAPNTVYSDDQLSGNIQSKMCAKSATMSTGCEDECETHEVKKSECSGADITMVK